MASGCPCVIAKGGGSQSLVEHGETGFLCEPNNPVSYLNRIEEILNSSDLRNKFITKGLAYTKKLDWDILASTYFKDIKQLHDLAHNPSNIKS